MSSPRTFVKTLYLDTVFNRSSSDRSDHWAGSTVKGWKVLDTNFPGFSIDVVADPENGSIQGIPMDFVRVHNYTRIAKSLVFENKQAVVGGYVRVLISVEDPIIDTRDAEGAPALTLSGPTSFSQSLITSSITSAVLLAPDSTRLGARFQYKSGSGTLWIGSAADVADPNYQNLCQQINPGSDFEWNNQSGLYHISSSPNIYSLIKEFK